MGNVFSSLWRFVRSRWGNASGMVNVQHHQIESINNAENENAIQAQDNSVNGKKLEKIERNERASRGETLHETMNAPIACKNADINICSARFVSIGNNDTINRHTTGRKMEAITVVCATVERGNQASSQVSSPANNINILSDMVVLGDGNQIYVSNIDRMFLVDLRGNVTQMLLFPLPSEVPQLPPLGVDSRSQKLFDTIAELINMLYPLRDSGKWQEFQNALKELRFKYRDYPEIQCFLLIEESVQLTYQKQLKKAKKLVGGVLKIIESEFSGASREVLRVLAYVASASMFRRQPSKKLGKAFKRLEKAKESAVMLKGVNLTIPKFAQAILSYEQGRCNMEFSTMKFKECIRTESQTSLGQAIDRFRDLSSNLYSARQCFALIHLASLALPSSIPISKEDNSQIIPKKDSARAQKLLREFERSTRLLNEVPVAAKIKNAITRSELCFLERNYSGAKKYGSQALEIAKQYGFELETVPAQENLNHICRNSGNCAPKITLAKLQDKASSSSTYTCSSSTDSDQRAS